MTCDLGGSPDYYAVELWFWNTPPGDYGANKRCASGLEADGKFYGAHWENLTDTTINFFRRPHDEYADQVRVRIWVREFKAY